MSTDLPVDVNIDEEALRLICLTCLVVIIAIFLTILSIRLRRCKTGKLDTPTKTSSHRSAMGDTLALCHRHLLWDLKRKINLRELKDLIRTTKTPLIDPVGCSSLEGIWLKLESKNIIGPGNYEILKKALEVIGRRDLVMVIEEHERKMKAFQPQPVAIDISKYAMSRSLVSGSFGNVYLFEMKEGNNEGIKQIVVKGKKHVKQVSSDKKFSTEVKILGKLNHPKIVQFLGSQDDGEKKLLIFLEYMSGGSIQHRLESEGPFKEKLTRKYTREILMGLEYIHSRGVIHRDINGSNILLNSSDTAKIAGFGMSIELCSLFSEPATELFAGTAPFMAPEVVRGDLEMYGTNLDIWSVGCTVVQMLTSHPPWNPYRNIPQIRYHIASNTYPEYELPKDVSEGARGFIRKCFTSNPELRPSAFQLFLNLQFNTWWLDINDEENENEDEDALFASYQSKEDEDDLSPSFAQVLLQRGFFDYDDLFMLHGELSDGELYNKLSKLPVQDDKGLAHVQDEDLRIRCLLHEDLAKEVRERGKGTTPQKLEHVKLPGLHVQEDKGINNVQRQDEQQVRSYRMTFSLDQPFKEDLKDEESEAYKKLKQEILDKLLRKAFGDDLKKISVLKFEEGSIQVNLVIELTGDKDIEELKEKLRKVEEEAHKMMQFKKSTLSFEVLTVNSDDTSEDTQEPAIGNIHDMHIEGDLTVHQDITINNPIRKDKADASVTSCLHANTNGKTHVVPLEHHWKICSMIGMDLWNSRCLFKVLLIITTCVFVPFIGYVIVQ